VLIGDEILVADIREKMKPGEHRCPGPSMRDYLLKDSFVPPHLLFESYRFEGDNDISFDRYTSAEFAKLEMQRLWPRVWQWACRVENVPEMGDYTTYEIGNHSFLIVRGNDSKIRAFYNSCLHRGVQLRPSEAFGNASVLRCPFHGWTYDLDGSLIDLPCRWDFPHVKDDDFHLPEAKVAVWGGFVFINMDLNAPAFEDYVGPTLLDHFQGNRDLTNRCISLHIRKELRCNWKAANEAFLESYHVFGTHPQAITVTNDAACQYDVFGDHVTRFVHAMGVPSPHYRGSATEQEILENLGFSLPHGVQLPPDETARAFAARYLRESVGARYNFDLSGFSDSEVFDATSYGIFPNGTFWPGISANYIYRFRPAGADPDRCFFDLVLLRPLAKGEKAPEPPVPIHLDVDEPFASVKDMNSELALVFDQDTVNLTQQQRGFHASKKGQETLGNYQEIRIRHLHNILDQYLARE
jgi:phenylpropionate dioxygenase-like ring-hydroxylating dioxygenase large terminal subunit